MPSSMFSYQKLKNLQGRAGDVDDELVLDRRSVAGGGGWEGRLGRRKWRWRRPKVRLAVLGRVLRGKAAKVRASMEKVTRLKEGRPYVSMQMNPTVFMPFFNKRSLLPASKLLQIATTLKKSPQGLLHETRS